MTVRVHHRSCATPLRHVWKRLSGAGIMVDEESRIHRTGTEVPAVHPRPLARVTTWVVYQAYRSPRKHSLTQVEDHSKRSARGTKSLERGVEDDVARSKSINIAGETISYRDGHKTRHIEDMGVATRLVTRAASSRVTVLQEANTASCKACGDRSVEPVDSFVYETDASLACTVKAH